MAILRRLMPTLYADAYFLAVHKPPRVNLETALGKRGPCLIEILAGGAVAPASDTGEEEGEAGLIPLILPERFASGLALFARTPEAARRFVGMAATNKLRFGHAAVVKGKLPRAKITVKGIPGRSGTKPSESRARKESLPSAKIEALQSHGEYHLVRCGMAAAGIEALRRCFKSVGWHVAGDVRPAPPNARHDAKPARRPLVHLESLHFPNPFKKGTISISDPPPRAFADYLASRRMTLEHMQVALVRRAGLLLDEHTDCFRLFTGRHEGVSGLVVDLLGKVVLIAALQGKYQGDEDSLRRLGSHYARVLGKKSVYARFVPKRPPGSSRARNPIGRLRLIQGEEAPEFIVCENGIKFLIRPEAGGAVGLFLDQRDNRHRIRALAEGKDVLNLFAYTCGFSVAAALGGAGSTTSVDLATKCLDWGRENFRANGIALENHTFIRGDAFEYLKRAERQQRRFDVVVIDPPSFARAKKPPRTFEIKKHLVELIAQAARLLRPGGRLLVSTNYRLVSKGWLIEQVERAAGDQSFKIVAQPRLPLDFAPDADYQKSLLVRFA